MRKLARAATCCIALLAAHGAVSSDKTVEIDFESGLIIAPGWEAVRTNCTICHSAKFITFQRGSRESWTSMIRWMQSTQGLWQFDPQTEDIILTYLAENYPPGKPSRRRNLPPGDLPPAPDNQ